MKNREKQIFSKVKKFSLYEKFRPRECLPGELRGILKKIAVSRHELSSGNQNDEPNVKDILEAIDTHFNAKSADVDQSLSFEKYQEGRHLSQRENELPQPKYKIKSRIFEKQLKEIELSNSQINIPKIPKSEISLAKMTKGSNILFDPTDYYHKQHKIFRAFQKENSQSRTNRKLVKQDTNWEKGVRPPYFQSSEVLMKSADPKIIIRCKTSSRVTGTPYRDPHCYTDVSIKDLSLGKSIRKKGAWIIQPVSSAHCSLNITGFMIRQKRDLR